jgi:hypothetical protein
MVKYAVTKEQSIRIEEITRMQSKSDLLHVYRQGRVTSSVVHSVGVSRIPQSPWFREFAIHKQQCFKLRLQST